jgi:hypothetical protein
MTRKRALHALVLPSALAHAVLLISPLCSPGADELLEEIRAANESAIQSMHTIACRVTTSSPTTPLGQPTPEATADYWWSAGSSRVREQGTGGTRESVFHDGIRRMLSRGKATDGREVLQFSISRRVPDQPHRPFDARHLALFTLAAPDRRFLTLDQLLNGPHKLRHVKRMVVEGQEFAVVAHAIELMPDQFGDFEVWFDPRANYLACKLIGTFPGLVQRESKVIRFREAAPAVYFPEHVETRFHTKEKLTNHQIIHFSNIRVNQPLPPRIFELVIPPGAQVLDSIQDKEYRLDANNKQVGAARALVKFPPLPAGTTRPTETTVEPKPWTHWIVPFSLGILGVGACLWLIRRWRSSVSV